MDLWKYFAIGHRHHVYCNPIAATKIDELIELLDLPDGGRILDIACGKAEFLVRAARRWESGGVGVDISPYFVADSLANVKAAGLEESIEIIEANGSDYDGEASSFDAAVCLGASWIWNGLEGSLRALSSFAKPGGLVIVGEPYWHGTPSPEHLEASGLTAASFDTHSGNVGQGLDAGLRFLHAISANVDDWDRYEGYQTYAAERYATENPEDPDVPEVLAGVRRARDHYLKWGRNELGWAIYLFAAP